jgi:hypothetical protein
MLRSIVHPAKARETDRAVQAARRLVDPKAVLRAQVLANFSSSSAMKPVR